MTSRLPGLLLLTFLGACAGAPPPGANTSQAGADPAPEQPTVPAETADGQAGAGAQKDAPHPPKEGLDEAKKSEVSAPKEPPPLKGSLTPVSSPAVACSPAAVQSSLEDLVKRCREDVKSVCGTLTVKAAKDADDVAVSLDVTTQDGVEEFVKCATDAMKGVRWECAEPGKDIKLQLGDCRL